MEIVEMIEAIRRCRMTLRWKTPTSELFRRGELELLGTAAGKMSKIMWGFIFDGRNIRHRALVEGWKPALADPRRSHSKGLPLVAGLFPASDGTLFNFEPLVNQCVAVVGIPLFNQGKGGSWHRTLADIEQRTERASGRWIV